MLVDVYDTEIHLVEVLIDKGWGFASYRPSSILTSVQVDLQVHKLIGGLVPIKLDILLF